MSSVPALTPISKPTGLTLNYVYTKRTDVSNITYVVLADKSGVVVDSSLSSIIVSNAFNAVNDLFVASDASSNYVSGNTDYFDYYFVNNTIKSVNDLTVTNGTEVPSGQGIIVDASRNRLRLDKAIITANVIRSIDVSATLLANMPLYNVNVSKSNNIKVNCFPIDISCTESTKVINVTSLLGAQNKFSFTVASASSTAYLKIENDVTSVSAYIANNTWPKVDAALAPMLLNSAIPVQSGYNSQDVLFNIPTNKIGTWFWTVTLYDNDVAISAPRTVQISLIPIYSQPVINFSNATYTVTKDVSNVPLKIQYADSDYTVDISNYVGTASGLKYDFRMYPNDITTAALADVSNFTLKFNGSQTNLLDTLRDVSNGARTLADISSNVSQTLPPVDLAFFQSFYKKSDVSKSYVLNYTGEFEYKLTTKSYTLAMDWANRNNAGGVVSTNLATVNITSTYTNNVSVSNLLNGLFRLSYSQTPMPAQSRFYVDYLDASGTKISTTSGPLRPDTSSNTGMQLDISANFLLYSAAKSFVAYVGNATNAYVYTKSTPAQEVSSITVPSMIVTTLTGAGNTFEQINVNEVAMLIDAFDPEDPNLDIISLLKDYDISGYYVRDFNIGVDINASIKLPLWFQSIVNPEVKFTIIDNDQCMTKFDICCNSGMTSSTGTTTKTVTITDISSYRNMNLDITFNPTFAQTTFQFSYSFTGLLDNSIRTFSSGIIVYYVPESQLPVTKNLGGNINYLYVHNNCKLSLDLVPPTSNGMSLQIVDSCFNYVWRNLATTANNKYDINLARSEFYPVASTNHKFVYTGIKITATKVAINSQKPKAFYSFSKAAKDVNTSAITFNMDHAFCTLPYSFIQLNSFVGEIEIQYSTTRDNITSTQVNILRLIVLPRPNITLTITDQSANLVSKSAADFNYNIKNIQLNGLLPLTFDNSWNTHSSGSNSDLSDNSFNSLLNSKIISYVKLSDGGVTIAPVPSSFDICQNTISTLNYNNVGLNSVIKFKGLDTSINRILEQVVTAKYTPFNSIKQLTSTSSFTITILTNNGNVVSDCVYANCLNAYKSISINNIDLAKYVLVDGVSSTTYALDQSCNATALWVFVQNVSLNKTVTITVGGNPFITGYSPLTTLPDIPANKRYAFYRLAADSWSYFGMI